MDILNRINQRYDFLTKLYEAVDGDTTKYVEADSLGFAESDLKLILQYTEDEHWIESIESSTITDYLLVRITHEGVKIVEDTFLYNLSSERCDGACGTA